MSENAVIRRMMLDDVDAAAKIEAASFSRPWSRADFVFEMARNPVARYLGAFVHGEMVGFAGAHVIMDEGHITNIAVSSRSRGAGIGRALLEGLMRYAANLGVRYMTLEVRVSNAAAIRLYEKLGFIKVSVRKKYYEDTGEDAWLMVCDRLPEPDADFREEETVSE